MIVEKLMLILEKNKSLENKLFLRNLLKEAIQDFVLNFVYNHPKYKKLIFTGGTCLRKVYGLPRLSEDVDFDFIKDFDLAKFSSEIQNYFAERLQYKKLTTKFSNRENTLYLRLPVLKDLGLARTPADNQILFVRCDFAKETGKNYKTEINSISTDEFTFFIRSFDLSTLFANKIVAFLQREFFRGAKQVIPFKGRDIFDLVWFLEKSAKLDFSLQPNWERIIEKLRVKNKKEIGGLLVDKIKKVNEKDLYRDLLPFIESPVTLETFAQNFPQIIENKMQFLLNKALANKKRTPESW